MAGRGSLRVAICWLRNDLRYHDNEVSYIMKFIHLCEKTLVHIIGVFLLSFKSTEIFSVKFSIMNKGHTIGILSMLFTNNIHSGNPKCLGILSCNRIYVEWHSVSPCSMQTCFHEAVLIYELTLYVIMITAKYLFVSELSCLHSSNVTVFSLQILLKANNNADVVLPVYCFDPCHFRVTYHFGFPKTGPHRAKFLLESVTDLRNTLRRKGR